MDQASNLRNIVKKNQVTAYIIFFSALALLLTSFVPEAFGVATKVTTVGLFIFSSLMVYPAIKLVRTKDDKYALKVMLMSYLYLIGSLIILLVDKLFFFNV